ncbi:MAG: adenylyl-sulfate kinase [Bacteroidales bacterium]|nr:adenylyl-sulfate kinase [Bacteroidales bacterium]
MGLRLNQAPKVIWLTGRPSAGKTTIAQALDRRLTDLGYLCRTLDGDVLRNGLNSNLGFNPSERVENIRRVAEVSKLFIETGIICINSFISPTESIRHMARTIIGAQNFIEIYVNAPADVCEQRDVKGMYKKARAGIIPEFTGVSSPFEAPLDPDVEIHTDTNQVEQCVEECLMHIIPRISQKP